MKKKIVSALLCVAMTFTALAGCGSKEEAAPVVNEEQTQEILKGIMSGVDVSLYADSHYSAGQMEQIRMALEAGKDVSPILDCNMSPEYMEQMRLQM